MDAELHGLFEAQRFGPHRNLNQAARMKKGLQTGVLMDRMASLVRFAFALISITCAVG